MAWRVLLVVGAVLALAFAGTALYAAEQVEEPRCTERRPAMPGESGYSPPGDDPELARILNEATGVCVAEDDAPLPILRSGSERWWWFGAVAVAVLTLASLPLALKRRP